MQQLFPWAYRSRRRKRHLDRFSLPGRSEVDEGDVDAFAALQLNAPRTGDRTVAVRLGDVIGQVAERLRHGHVPVSHPVTFRVAHRHHCNVQSAHHFKWRSSCSVQPSATKV